MHRAVMKLIIVLLMSLVVGTSAAASVAARSHALSDPLQSSVSLLAIDTDNSELDHPASLETCHEACSWLVAWFWPVAAPVRRIRPNQAFDTQSSVPARLILPPPRSA